MRTTRKRVVCIFMSEFIVGEGVTALDFNERA